MKIRFTHNFQGKLTHERYYLDGDIIEVDEDLGRELIALKHAVEVVEPVPAPKGKHDAAKKP